jgi:hypothetical protein
MIQSSLFLYNKSSSALSAICHTPWSTVLIKLLCPYLKSLVMAFIRYQSKAFADSSVRFSSMAGRGITCFPKAMQKVHLKKTGE